MKIDLMPKYRNLTFFFGFRSKKKPRSRPTNGPTDQPTNQWTNGLTNPLEELQFATKSQRKKVKTRRNGKRTAC